MGLTAEVFDAAAEPTLPPPQWDRFVRCRSLTPAWSAAALRALATRPRRHWLGMVEDGGEVVALACGRHYGLATARGPLPGLFECKLPVGGTRPGFVFAEGLNVAERRAALRALEARLPRRLGWSCLGIAYRQVTAADLEVCGGGAWRPRLATAPDEWIGNRWASMDRYFADLPRHARHRLRSTSRSLARDPELAIAWCEDGVAGDEASRLVELTMRRHRRSGAAPPAAWFDALRGQEGVRYLSYRDGAGRLLAFSLVLDDGAHLRYALWGSLDPRGGGRPHLYFDSYLQVVRRMIERGRDGSFLGKGMAETKRRFGCQPVPQHVVVVPR